MHKVKNIVFRESLKAFGHLKYLFILERATVVIPCFNEEKTVGIVVKAARACPLVSDVVVVDDGSSDSSSRVAREAGARVVRHSKNKGKGAAILSGAKAAKNSVLVFVDADFENITSGVLEKLALPVLENDAAFVKSTFDREGGRVTELTAKPLLEFIFPEVTFSQPLSGQFATRREFLAQLEVSKDWGIDLELLLDSIALGEKVVEVNIGEIRHKHRPLNELSKTAKEVTRTILQKAGFLAKKHKLVIFDFDKTLIAESSASLLARELKFEKQLQSAREKFFAGEISERELCKKIAAMLEGVPAEKLSQAASKAKKNAFADGTLGYLKRMGYKIAMVSFAYGQVIGAVFGKGVFDEIICPALESKGGSFTGKVRIPAYASERHVFNKGAAAKALMKKFKVKADETIAVGDAVADQDMLKVVGVPVAIGNKKLRPAAFHIKSLPELIVIAS